LILNSLQSADDFSRLLPHNRAQANKQEALEMNLDQCFLKHPAQNHETSEPWLISIEHYWTYFDLGTAYSCQTNQLLKKSQKTTWA